QPQSGLYAWVSDQDRRVLWRSPSTLAGGAPRPPMGDDPQPGEFVLREAVGSEDGLLRLSYTVIWEDPFELLLTFHVAADWTPFQAQIVSFRRNLYVGVAGVTALFVLEQLLAMRLALRPLRSMAQEEREMEEGHRRRLSDSYPRELIGLADNLVRFV